MIAKGVAISDLTNIKLFAPLSPQERQSLLDAGTVHDVTPGTKIVQAGAEGNSLYVILSGLVRVFRDADGGQSIELARLGEGSCFGEMSLLTGERRSANVAAQTAVRILEIPKRALVPVFEKRPALYDQLAAIMAERKLANERTLAGQSAPINLMNETTHAMAKRIRQYFAG
jgi:CRP-like cAMP-binding protein